MSAFRTGWPEEGIALALIGLGVAVGYPAFGDLLLGTGGELALAAAAVLAIAGIAFGMTIALGVVFNHVFPYIGAGLVAACVCGYAAFQHAVAGWRFAFGALALLALLAFGVPVAAAIVHARANAKQARM